MPTRLLEYCWIRRTALRDKSVAWLAAAVLLSTCLWIGSIWFVVVINSWSGRHSLFISNGLLQMSHRPVDLVTDVVYVDWNDAAPSLVWRFKWYKLGDFWGLEIPLWMFVVTNLLLLCVAIRRALRSDRFERCLNCGYDHTGLGRSNRCPECGS